MTVFTSPCEIAYTYPFTYLQPEKVLSSGAVEEVPLEAFIRRL